MKWPICLAIFAWACLGIFQSGCRNEETQPKIIKVDEYRYEIRYSNDTDLADIARTVCKGMYEAADLGKRSDSSGANVKVGVVRCIGEAKANGAQTETQ